MTRPIVWMAVIMVLLTGCGLTQATTPAPEALVNTPAPVLPTNTLIQATITRAPPATLPASPTATPLPSTNTPVPPTNTAKPPTLTPVSTIFVSTLSAPPDAGTSRTRLADGMVMVYVPAGKFLMGSSDQDLHASGNEKPQHSVDLEAFWVDITEVTVAHFRAFVAATGYQTAAEKKGWAYAYVEKAKEWQRVNGADWLHPFGPESNAEDNHPVTQVSWDDAAAYCTWVGGSLPGEAQWEKAARGTDGRIYPWGNDFDGTLLNYCDSRCGGDSRYNDGYRFTAPVGSYPSAASMYGALDMAGNVWEWTADGYTASYKPNASKNPNGLARVLRGGSWNHDPTGMRAAYRLEAPPDTLVDNFGFRCVVQAEPEK
jgi:formylglycine-generating enzyme required for sulfatase activity